MTVVGEMNSKGESKGLKWRGVKRGVWREVRQCHPVMREWKEAAEGRWKDVTAVCASCQAKLKVKVEGGRVRKVLIRQARQNRLCAEKEVEEGCWCWWWSRGRGEEPELRCASLTSVKRRVKVREEWRTSWSDEELRLSWVWRYGSRGEEACAALKSRVIEQWRGEREERKRVNHWMSHWSKCWIHHSNRSSTEVKYDRTRSGDESRMRWGREEGRAGGNAIERSMGISIQVVVGVLPISHWATLVHYPHSSTQPAHSLHAWTSITLCCPAPFSNLPPLPPLLSLSCPSLLSPFSVRW
jgi:hypothetical protein